MTRIPPILVVVVAGALAALSILNVRFSAEIYNLLPQDLPEVRGLEQVNQFFGRHEQLIVTIQGENRWAVEEAAAALAEHLRKQDEDIAQVFRELTIEELVTRGGNLLAWSWLNAQPEAVSALRERLAPERSQTVIDESLATVQEALSSEGSLVTSYDPLRLADLDGSAAHSDPMRSRSGLFEVLHVEGRGVDFSDYRAAKVWLDRLKTEVSAWQQEWDQDRPPEARVRVGLTGTPAFMAEVGTEMEKDMTVSVMMTLILISALFFLMHRQLKPLSWLMAAMLVVLSITLTLGGLLYGDLSVMSVGFAAILVGLAVDYGIVLYREARDTGRPAADVRRGVGSGILWAAATTAVVFLSLNLSSLPGLAEMGNLVAIGVAVGAAVMLVFFAPVASSFARSSPSPVSPPCHTAAPCGRAALFTGLFLPCLAAASILFGEPPRLEANFHPFRIRESPSMKSWQDFQLALRGHAQSVPTIVTAENLADLHERLESLEARLVAAHDAGLVSSFQLPTGWVPNPARQQANSPTLAQLLGEQDRLLAELDEAGFSEQGAALTSAVFGSWKRFLDGRPPDAQEPVLPSDELAAWAVERIFRAKDGTVAALAVVTPASPRERAWVAAICDDHTKVASLHSLGTALNERIRGDLLRVFLPMMGLLGIALSLVFRSWRDLVLSLACLLFTAAALVLLTRLSLLQWNSFNVCGLPILFGTGLDFSIHMIFSLRRFQGDLRAARRRMGKAQLFCGGSSAIGFGSLATASAHGLSSLGIVCAAGILINMFVAVVLLPHWYRTIHRHRTAPGCNSAQSD